MKKTMFVVIFGFCFLGIYMLCYKHLNKRWNRPNITLLKNMNEIDSDFGLEGDTLLCSRYDGLKYNLYKNTTRIIQSTNSVFHPFKFKNHIIALEDSVNTGYYLPTDKTLRRLCKGNSIDKIFSLSDGKYLVIKEVNDSNIYLIDSISLIKRKIATVKENFNSAVYCHTKRSIIISYDSTVTEINILQNQSQELFPDFKGEKLNLHIEGNTLLFCSNSYSEFFNIYQFNVLKESAIPTLVYSSKHDLRLPLIDSKWLYFIELINGEYILKKLDLHTRRIVNITQKGVVYNVLSTTQNLYFSYSDLNTPKSLFLYKKSGGVLIKLTRNQLVSFKFLSNPLKNTKNHTYELYSKNTHLKGIIIYIHPGIQSDYSPRWDPLLNNLCINGYKIICPNFPSSAGYGKYYLNMGDREALIDLLNCTNYVKRKYNLPVYYLSISAGSRLMELLLKNFNPEVEAGVSLFGIPNDNGLITTAVPTYFILGEKDRLINYSYRSQQILFSKKTSPLVLKSYKDEGHWFRNSGNLNNSISEILSFFYKNND